MGSGSTSPKTSPTEISTVSATSAVPTLQAEEASAEEQKADGMTAMSVASNTSATDVQNCDASRSVREREQLNPDSDVDPSSSKASKDSTSESGNKGSESSALPKGPD